VVSFGLVFSQCIIDPAYANEDGGIWPDTIDNLPCGSANTYYETILQLKAFDSVIIGPFLFPVNWIRLDSISGLPVGMTYVTDVSTSIPPDQWNAGEQGCVTIMGQDVAGNYPISFMFTIELNVVGTGGPYTYSGYDLFLSEPNTIVDVQTACDSFVWIDGNTYTESNDTATYTITNSTPTECDDSVVILNLSLGPFTASVTPVAYMLSAEPAGAAYQWLACDTISVGFPPVIITTSVIIPGATNQDFTPTEIGHYAVVVTSGSCSDTSDCEYVSVVGMQEKKKSELRLHPNPTTGILIIEGAEGIASIYDIYGRLVLTANTNTLDISNAALELHEQNKQYALVTMCIGVGQGYATVIEKV